MNLSTNFKDLAMTMSTFSHEWVTGSRLTFLLQLQKCTKIQTLANRQYRTLISKRRKIINMSPTLDTDFSLGSIFTLRCREVENKQSLMFLWSWGDRHPKVRKAKVVRIHRADKWRGESYGKNSRNLKNGSFDFLAEY